MARWAPARADVIGEVADEFLHNFPRGHSILGVDGRGGAGKTTFAAELSASFAARGVGSVSLSLDAFLSDPAVRDPGASDPRSDYEHRYDYAAFRARAIEPFRRGEPVALEYRSRVTGGLVSDPLTWLPETNAVLVVEGSFLHRPEIVGIWHSSLWLDVSKDQSIACGVERDEIDDGVIRALADADDVYIAAVDPRRRAFANIDMTEPAHPRRTFSDSC